MVGFKEPISDEKVKQIQDLNLKVAGSDEALEWRKLEGQFAARSSVDSSTHPSWT